MKDLFMDAAVVSAFFGTILTFSNAAIWYWVRRTDSKLDKQNGSLASHEKRLIKQELYQEASVAAMIAMKESAEALGEKIHQIDLNCIANHPKYMQKIREEN
jgi:hypothetical protein